jgi:hypothetical protein
MEKITEGAKRARCGADSAGASSKRTTSANQGTASGRLTSFDQSMTAAIVSLEHLGQELSVAQGGDDDADAVHRAIVVAASVCNGFADEIESLTTGEDHRFLLALGTDVRFDLSATDPAASLSPPSGAAAAAFSAAMERLLNVGQWMLHAGKSAVFPSLVSPM